MKRVAPFSNSIHAFGLGLAGLATSGLVGSFYMRETFETEAHAAEVALEFLAERPALELRLATDIELAKDKASELETAVGEACMQLVNGSLTAEDVVRAATGGDRCDLSDGYIVTTRSVLDDYETKRAELQNMRNLVVLDSNNVAKVKAVITDGEEESWDDITPFDGHRYTEVQLNSVTRSGYVQTERNGESANVLDLVQLAAMTSFIGSAGLLLYGAGLEVKEKMAERLSRRRFIAMVREDIESIDDFVNQK